MVATFVAGVLSPLLAGETAQESSTPTRAADSRLGPGTQTGESLSKTANLPAGAASSSTETQPSPRAEAVKVTLSAEARALQLKGQGESPSQIATMLNTTVAEVDSMLDITAVPPSALVSTLHVAGSALSA